VQRLAELTGARVSLASRPGNGTRFTLELPGALRVAARPPEQAAPEPTPFISQRRIYVVDDEQDILKSMRTLLSLWGIEAHTAIGGPELRALFARQGVPDLLIADLRLGGGEHGARLAGDLQRSYGAFPVLILTGETSSEALREAKLADYPVLRKPIAAEQLHEAILAASGESAVPAVSLPPWGGG
jgi:two-component system, sensor histidine kinase